MSFLKFLVDSSVQKVHFLTRFWALKGRQDGHRVHEVPRVGILRWVKVVKWMVRMNLGIVDDQVMAKSWPWPFVFFLVLPIWR